MTPERYFLGLASTEWIAILTFVLAIMALVQACIYWGMHQTTQRVERAYVGMSHTPPGLQFGFTSSSGKNETHVQDVIMKIKISNSGHTPARIIRTVIQPVVAPNLPTLPGTDIPTYDENFAESVQAVIAPNDGVLIPKVFHIPFSELSKARAPGFADRSPELRLFIIGYVDYEDRFSKMHRAGYARMYDSWQDVKEGITPDDPRSLTPTEAAERYKNRNNLVFNGSRGYNYDIEVDGQGRPKNPKEQP